MQDKSDEPWLQAINLLKATNDRDGLALAYWYWGATKQDYQAEVFLSRAIKYWKQEPGVFDETLSHMYRLYSSNLGMQGKIEEARSAAQKAISLYPSDYPDYLEEEIESYL
jgi:tetratricopeptide (TPR) repeat protein